MWSMYLPVHIHVQYDNAKRNVHIVIPKRGLKWWWLMASHSVKDRLINGLDMFRSVFPSSVPRIFGLTYWAFNPRSNSETVITKKQSVNLEPEFLRRKIAAILSPTIKIIIIISFRKQYLQKYGIFIFIFFLVSLKKISCFLSNKPKRCSPSVTKTKIEAGLVLDALHV